MLEEIEMRDHTAREVLAHLCSQSCHGFAEAVEICESRGDCVIVITCPGCRRTFTLDDEQYEMLLTWTTSSGNQFACGIHPLPA